MFPHCRVAVLLMLASLILSACGGVAVRGYSESEHIERPEDPPQTLAILPTADLSGHPELAEVFRESLYRAVSVLPYKDKELAEIDAVMATLAYQHQCSPAQLPESALVTPDLADYVVFTRLEKVGRLYLLLYAHVRYDLHLAMVDTRTRRVIYRNHFVVRDWTGGATISPLGLLERSFSSILQLRGKRMNESMEEGAEKIADALPCPVYVETPPLSETTRIAQLPSPPIP